MDGNFTRLKDGNLVPSIPEPFWYGGGWRSFFRKYPACYRCTDLKGKSPLIFKTKEDWNEHYLKMHSVNDITL